MYGIQLAVSHAPERRGLGGQAVRNQYVWIGNQNKEVYYDGLGNMVYGFLFNIKSPSLLITQKRAKFFSENEDFSILGARNGTIRPSLCCSIKPKPNGYILSLSAGCWVEVLLLTVNCLPTVDHVT